MGFHLQSHNTVTMQYKYIERTISSRLLINFQLTKKTLSHPHLSLRSSFDGGFVSVKTTLVASADVLFLEIYGFSTVDNGRNMEIIRGSSLVSDEIVPVEIRAIGPFQIRNRAVGGYRLFG